jgi:hypothetical protein
MTEGALDAVLDGDDRPVLTDPCRSIPLVLLEPSRATSSRLDIRDTYMESPSFERTGVIFHPRSLPRSTRLKNHCSCLVGDGGDGPLTRLLTFEWKYTNSSTQLNSL